MAGVECGWCVDGAWLVCGWFADGVWLCGWSVAGVFVVHG